jgi:membrane protease YdiL (CAAX protease family)
VSGPASTTPARPGLIEPLATFFVATAVASAAYWVGQRLAAVGSNLHGIIAIVFLYAPAVAARIAHRPFDYRLAGLRVDPLRLNLVTIGLGVGISFPIFLGASCQQDPGRFLQWWAELFAPVCSHWLGAESASFHLPPNFLLLSVSQIVAVALPEELFFRGYLLGRFEERWPSTRTFWGAPVGKALVLSSALFAIGHVLVDFDPRRLTVFFPGLAFGWMRARTGSLLPGAIFHALCNLLSDVLYASFFR